MVRSRRSGSRGRILDRTSAVALLATCETRAVSDAGTCIRARACIEAMPLSRLHVSEGSSAVPAARAPRRGSFDNGAGALTVRIALLRVGDSTSAAAAPWTGAGVAKRAYGRWGNPPWKQASGRWSETHLSPIAGPTPPRAESPRCACRIAPAAASRPRPRNSEGLCARFGQSRVRSPKPRCTVIWPQLGAIEGEGPLPARCVSGASCFGDQTAGRSRTHGAMRSGCVSEGDDSVVVAVRMTPDVREGDWPSIPIEPARPHPTRCLTAARCDAYESRSGAAGQEAPIHLCPSR